MVDPADWRRFVTSIERNVPPSPIPEARRRTGASLTTDAAAGIVTYGGAGASGFGVEVPLGTGLAIGMVAGAQGDEDARWKSLIDEVIGWVVGRVVGPGPGASVVAGGQMVVEGMYASLTRSDAIREYLVQLTAYATTLVRYAGNARSSLSPHVTPPLPRIPHYMRVPGPRGGSEFTLCNNEFNINAYERGYLRVSENVPRETDVLASVSDAYPSKQCFRHLADLIGVPEGRVDMYRWLGCEERIFSELLGIDMQVLPEQLRVWAARG